MSNIRRAREVFVWIEAWYNPRRRHCALVHLCKFHRLGLSKIGRQAFPLELKVPTQAAIEELEAGNGIKTDAIQALLKELNAQA